MSMIRRLIVLAFVLVSVSAEALPTEKLYVTATRLLEAAGPIFYIGYLTLEEDETKRIGYQLQPMEESVADTISGLSVEKMFECDGRYFRNGRFVYVYSLTNCK
jgi:hypothetical protein